MARGLMVTYRVWVDEQDIRGIATHWRGLLPAEGLTDAVPVSFVGPAGGLTGGVAEGEDVDAYLAMGGRHTPYPEDAPIFSRGRRGES